MARKALEWFKCDYCGIGSNNGTEVFEHQQRCKRDFGAMPVMRRSKK